MIDLFITSDTLYILYYLTFFNMCIVLPHLVAYVHSDRATDTESQAHVTQRP